MLRHEKQGDAMDQTQYHMYLQAEIANIMRFKEEEERATGCQLSRNAAAAIWIERYAASYRERMQPDGHAMQGHLAATR